MTAEDFGRLVIEEGMLGRQASAASGRNQAHEAAGCYDLREAGALKTSVDALASALSNVDSKKDVMALRSDSSQGELITYLHPAFVDLHDLCRRIAASERFSEQVRAAGGEAMQAVDRFMIASFGMSHYANFEAGKNGVFIVLPPDEPDVWKRFGWYTPVKGESQSYGNWSFLKHGATPGNGVVENWYELLDSWFNVAASDASAGK
jgi:clostripain